jgi:hypothetical protein
MQVTTDEIIPGKLYQINVSQLIDVPHLKALVEHFWNSYEDVFDDNVNLIWNGLDAELPNVSLQDAIKLAGEINASKTINRPGKTAIVVRNGFFMHIANTFVNILNINYFREPKVFTDLTKARAYVDSES